MHSSSIVTHFVLFLVATLLAIISMGNGEFQCWHGFYAEAELQVHLPELGLHNSGIRMPLKTYSVTKSTKNCPNDVLKCYKSLCTISKDAIIERIDKKLFPENAIYEVEEGTELEAFYYGCAQNCSFGTHSPAEGMTCHTHWCCENDDNCNGVPVPFRFGTFVTVFVATLTSGKG
ncbi:hypothetical protein niasHS_006070 [Heterodera schachtii]|uniref:Uncharacterized protein n=1 Tax=Heterodera schachtii TaxID=97005 RepID=A0ABD2JVU5_HETSC